MKIIVGLGNPGQTFRDTRHNAGFMVIQQLADRHQAVLRTRIVNPADGRAVAVAGEYADGGDAVRLVMPLTMMNESGEALRALGAAPETLLIVCDDVNLPLGMLRMRPGGSDGGHHGLASCLQALGTEQLQRLRIGVGTEPLPRDLVEFVLTPFRSAERPVIKPAISQAADACEVWAKEGVECAMNRYNKAQAA